MKTKHTTHSEQELREHLKSIFSKHVSLYGTSELMIDDILLLIQSEREKIIEEVIKFGAEWRLKLNQTENKNITDEIKGMEKGILYYQQKLAKLAQKEESK